MSAALRLAYLDNGKEPDRVSGLPEFFAAQGMDVATFRAFDGVFPDDPASFDGILLSGSALSAYDDIDFVHREHDFIRQVADAGTPMLGLCFGSQILASALCGKEQVFRRGGCEVGHATLSASAAAADDALLGGLGPDVEMFVWHNDEVRADHPDMVVLASSSQCPNHIWRFRDQTIWGVQGHPELSRENASMWIGKAAAALRQDGADPERLIAETGDGLTGRALLGNFTRVCQSSASSKKGE